MFPLSPRTLLSYRRLFLKRKLQYQHGKISRTFAERSVQNDTICINFELGTKRYFLLFRQARWGYATGVKAMVSFGVAGGWGGVDWEGLRGRLLGGWSFF